MGAHGFKTASSDAQFRDSLDAEDPWCETYVYAVADMSWQVSLIADKAGRCGECP